MIKREITVFYGPNGAGKTTIARYLATKNKGLHIQLDWYSSMQRGKEWYTKNNNREKINLLLGTLDAVVTKTRYNKIYLDGVLLYTFMFKMLEVWCKNNKINYKFVKLVGSEKKLAYRVTKRRKPRKNDWNKKLPKIYKHFTYPSSLEIDTTGKGISKVIKYLT
ncbi:MAG: AAA family ATPase [Candidatus Pacebacteria bacterium]|nr:AAA family ATPase [Candidatus Paceibacterota bacterium]